MQLDQYQRDAIDFGLEHKRFGMILPIGGRKTATSLVWARETGARRILIVAGAQVQAHWVRSAAQWFPELAVHEYRGTPVFRGQIRQRFQAEPGPAALVVGYEMVRQDVAVLEKLGLDAVIADEAHRLRTRNTVLFKVFEKLTGKVEWLNLTTGSKVWNESHEIWSLFHLIDPKGYRSFWRWAKQHFEIEIEQFGFNKRPVQIVGKALDGHLDLIREEARAHLFEADVKVLPHDPVHTVIPVHLTAEERRIYEQFMKKGWAKLGEGEAIVTPNTVSKTTRLRQLASDWGNIAPELGLGSKVKAALQLAEDLGEPVVVFSAFKETARRIAKETDGVEYMGGMSQAERQAAIDAFVAGKASVFSATLGAASEGLDGLQHVSHDLVLVDRHWVEEGNKQVIGRLQRSGQKDIVRVWHIAAADTVDEDVALANAEQRDATEALNLAVG